MQNNYQLVSEKKVKIKAQTLCSICTVKRGNAAAAAERTMVFAANAEAEYVRYVSMR
jgi:hypothetical protein